MKDTYLTYFDSDLLPDDNGVKIDTKYLMDLLGQAMKDNGSTKVPYQITPDPKTKNKKYKYLLIGC